ncbi:MAG: MgtC/SapB family protein, partial [Clostridia bacterium]|nr:MgtC/SapB family protein [Clostridia bacterium]
MEQIITYLREFNYATIAFRLLLAILAGGIIGNERGKHGSAAGLRTHILVCVGAAM